MREVDYEFLTEEDLSATDAAFGIEADGEEFISQTLSSSPGKISVMSIAPMTSVAKTINPGGLQQAKRIYLMGGYVH